MDLCVAIQSCPPSSDIASLFRTDIPETQSSCDSHSVGTCRHIDALRSRSIIRMFGSRIVEKFQVFMVVVQNWLRLLGVSR